MLKNIIDFHGASHGHFVEYIINSWIYNGIRFPNIFTELGTCHIPSQNKEYSHSLMIKCNHFSEKQIFLHNTPEKIVRITTDTDVGKWIHAINLLHRAGDISLTENYKEIPTEVLCSAALLRTNWFSKLTDYENSYKIDYVWQWEDVTDFKFPMEDLYDFFKLCQTMLACANYLGQKFTPDKEFYLVWEKFIKLNQGVQAYNKSKKILELTLSQIDYEFTATEYEQALINVMLTKTVGMFDGPVFTDDNYPTTTKDIWNQIYQHQISFDSKF